MARQVVLLGAGFETWLPTRDAETTNGVRVGLSWPQAAVAGRLVQLDGAAASDVSASRTHRGKGIGAAPTVRRSDRTVSRGLAPGYTTKIAIAR
jgi:hypothetical protein